MLTCCTEGMTADSHSGLLGFDHNILKVVGSWVVHLDPVYSILKVGSRVRSLDSDYNIPMAGSRQHRLDQLG